MPLWTTEYLERLALEAEIAIADEIPCIIDRYSLGITQYLGEYQLPDYVRNIRAVYWKGIRLDPTAQLEIPDYPIAYSEESGGAFESSAFDANSFETGGYVVKHGSSGKPDSYWYSTYGENVIRFFPIPNEAITDNSNNNDGNSESFSYGAFQADAFNSDAFDTDISGEGGIWGPAIADAVIVEYYRVPDGITWKIPDYIRRRTIKAYVLAKAFAKEGDGQNLRAAKYWGNKYAILLNRARTIINGVYQAEVRSRSNTVYSEYSECIRPPRPRLPWNWEVVTVDDYEY